MDAVYLKYFLQRIHNAFIHLAPIYLFFLYLSIPKLYDTIGLFPLLFFFISSIITIGAGYYINDFFDGEFDAHSRNKVSIEKLSSFFRQILLLILFATSLFSWMLTNAPLVATLLFSIQWILLILYSLPPIRLKNRGLLGYFCDAHYSSIIPFFITLTFTNFHINTILVVLIYMLLLVKGVRNIWLHQIEDRRIDKLANQQNYVNSFPLQHTFFYLNKIIIPFEFSLLLIISIATFNTFPLLLFSLFIFMLTFLIEHTCWFFYRFPKRNFTKMFLYTLNDFYEDYIPYVGIISLQISAFYKTLFLCLHAVLFWKKTKRIPQKLLLCFERLFTLKYI